MILRQLVGTLVGTVAVVSAFSSTSTSFGHRHSKTAAFATDNDEDSASLSDRRNWMVSSMTTAVGLASLPLTSTAEDAPTTAAAPTTNKEGVTMYKTPSGLKYIELETGNASTPTPRYGQLCIISYKAYLKLPNSKDRDQFDSSGPYIMKHGNGKMIAGLDEGLHTMRAGGLRQLIIPPKLGFVQIGLGPLPQYPWNRIKLNSLLDKMVEQQGGNLVYDIRLEKIFDDEADQGYYEDAELTPEQVEELQKRLLRRPS